MNEEALKELLGDKFEGAQKFFKDQVLGNGDYVTKGKADAEKSDLQKKLNDLQEQMKSKMSEDEKKMAADKEKDDLIEKLQKQLAENAIDTSKSKALSGIAEAMTLIELKSDDKELNAFISNISTEDSNKTLEISSYVNKIVKDAFEKGKASATKQNLGKMGNFNANAGSNQGKENEDVGARLAKANIVKPTQSSYFQN